MATTRKPVTPQEARKLAQREYDDGNPALGHALSSLADQVASAGIPADVLDDLLSSAAFAVEAIEQSLHKVTPYTDEWEHLRAQRVRAQKALDWLQDASGIEG